MRLARQIGMVLGVVLGAVLIGPAPSSSAQEAIDPALVQLGAQLWKQDYPCRNCHGGMADGIGDIPQEEGPSLYQAALTMEQLAEVIRCGRPGTGMPFFDQRAYTDGRCFGLTEADLGDAMPPRGAPNATQRSINALVAFIYANFIGKPEPTYATCVAIWGDGAQNCDRFPR